MNQLNDSFIGRRLTNPTREFCYCAFLYPTIRKSFCCWKLRSHRNRSFREGMRLESPNGYK